MAILLFADLYTNQDQLPFALSPFSFSPTLKPATRQLSDVYKGRQIVRESLSFLAGAPTPDSVQRVFFWGPEKDGAPDVTEPPFFGEARTPDGRFGGPPKNYIRGPNREHTLLVNFVGGVNFG